MIIKFGKASFNSEAFHDYTEKKFTDEYAGKLSVDVKEVWKEISKHIPKKRKKKEELD